MKNALVVSAMLAAAALSLSAFAEGKEKGEGPCKQIKEACEKAGFVKGEWKEGNGLWKDCIGPIMKGEAAPAGKTLPSVDASVVSACKAKHPNFGEGRGKMGKEKGEKK